MRSWLGDHAVDLSDVAGVTAEPDDDALEDDAHVWLESGGEVVVIGFPLDRTANELVNVGSVDGRASVLIATLTHVLPPAPTAGAAPLENGWTGLALDPATVRAVRDALPADSVDTYAQRAFDAVLEGREPAALRVATDREAGEAMFVVAPGWDRPAWDQIARLPDSAMTGDETHDLRVLLRHDGLVVRFPADLWALERLAPHIDDRAVDFSDAARRLWRDLAARRAEADELVALSAAMDAGIDVPRLGAELRPFQRAAVAWRWLPHRSVEVRWGRGLTVQRPPAADVIIVNCDILDAHRETLAATGARALVLDESHHVKNPRAARTQAAGALSEALPDDALRLALTGTPILNRPDELVAQLRAVGRLAEFGSGARFKRRFRDPQARERLHCASARSSVSRRGESSPPRSPGSGTSAPAASHRRVRPPAGGAGPAARRVPGRGPHPRTRPCR